MSGYKCALTAKALETVFELKRLDERAASDEAVGDLLGMQYVSQAVLTDGRCIKVSVDPTDDLEELVAALTARRDELAQWDARFQVPVIVQTPDPVFTFRSVFHEWKEVSTEEMVRRGWHPSYLQAAAMLGH